MDTNVLVTFFRDAGTTAEESFAALRHAGAQGPLVVSAPVYAEILAEECEADPDFANLLGQEPSTGTLVELVRGMVGHFMEASDGSDQEEAQRLRLMTTSHLDDGEFFCQHTRLLALAVRGQIAAD